MRVSALQQGTSILITIASSIGLFLRISSTLSKRARSSSLGQPMITGFPAIILFLKSSMTNAVQSAANTTVPLYLSDTGGTRANWIGHWGPSGPMGALPGQAIVWMCPCSWAGWRSTKEIAPCGHAGRQSPSPSQ